MAGSREAHRAGAKQPGNWGTRTVVTTLVVDVRDGGDNRRIVAYDITADLTRAPAGARSRAEGKMTVMVSVYENDEPEDCLLSFVTRDEVWAAIEEWVNEAGCVCDDLTYTTARLAPLRQRVRDLLGMEAE